MFVRKSCLMVLALAFTMFGLVGCKKGGDGEAEGEGGAETDETKEAQSTRETPQNWEGVVGTAEDDEATGVAVGESGAVYVSGTAGGELDGREFAGKRDAFVAKYEDGERQWLRLVGTPKGDEGTDVVTDGEGHVYLVGQVRGGVDGEEFNGGFGDAFMAKYDETGERQWLRLVGTSGNDIGYGASVDSSGHVYLAGMTSEDWGEQSFGGGHSDAFVAKYDGDGRRQWVRLQGDSGEEKALGVAVAPSGAVYLAARGADKLGGRKDVIVSKYGEDGERGWEDTLGTSNDDEAFAVATDSDGGVYVSGMTVEGLGGQSSEPPASDAFVVKYDETGERQWVDVFGSPKGQQARGVTTDASGTVYVTGSTVGPIGGETYHGGMNDAFVATYEAGGERQSITLVGTDEKDITNDIAAAGSDVLHICGLTEGEIGGQSHAGGEDAFVAELDR